MCTCTYVHTAFEYRYIMLITNKYYYNIFFLNTGIFFTKRIQKNPNINKKGEET